MEMLVLLVFVVLMIPLFIQFKYGVKAICGWIKLEFWQLTILTFLGELLWSFILFFLIGYAESLFVERDVNQVRCGLGLAGIAIFGIPISGLILFIIVVR
jgi:hypothetical protein